MASMGERAAAAVAKGIGTTLGMAKGIGSFAAKAWRGATSEPVARNVYGALSGAGGIIANTPGAAVKAGAATLEGGRKLWGFVGETRRFADPRTGRTLFKYPFFKKGIMKAVVPAAFGYGLVKGMYKGGLEASMGYVNTAPMHNMIYPTEELPIARHVSMRPKDFGATGDLVFALHKLRGGGR